MKSQALLSATLLIASACDSLKPEKKQVVYETLEASAEISALENVSSSLARVKFVSPKQDLTSNGSVAVELNFPNVPSNATFGLYYGPESGNFLASTAIYRDLSISENVLSWETGSDLGLQSGAYYFFILLKVGEATSIHQSSARITVNAAGGQNLSPFVALVNPNGFDPNSGGTTNDGQNVGSPRVFYPGHADARLSGVPIRFDGYDPEGEELSYAVHYSPDAGATWVLVQEGLNDDMNSFTWELPPLSSTLVQSARYKIRVTATDPQGLSATAVSNQMFGIAAEPVTYSAFRDDLLTSCGGCHGDAADPNATKESNFSVFAFAPTEANMEGFGTNNNTKRAAVERTRLDAPAAARMPPSGSPDISDELRDAIQLWRWTGTTE